jgi:hypothetical protein
MGMDLIPKNNQVEPAGFNVCGWQTLIRFLQENNCDTSALSRFNDGEYIPASVCHAIADCIEQHMDSFVFELEPDVAYEPDATVESVTQDSRDYFKRTIPFWRNCKGCYQW